MTDCGEVNVDWMIVCVAVRTLPAGGGVLAGPSLLLTQGAV